MGSEGPMRPTRRPRTPKPRVYVIVCVSATASAHGPRRIHHGAALSPDAVSSSSPSDTSEEPTRLALSIPSTAAVRRTISWSPPRWRSSRCPPPPGGLHRGVGVPWWTSRRDTAVNERRTTVESRATIIIVLSCRAHPKAEYVVTSAALRAAMDPPAPRPPRHSPTPSTRPRGLRPDSRPSLEASLTPSPGSERVAHPLEHAHAGSLPRRRLAPFAAGSPAPPRLLLQERDLRGGPDSAP